MLRTYQQLLVDGWTPKRVANAAADGRLRRVRRGVYADEHPLALDERVRAELMQAPHAVASHHTAALLHGFGDARTADLVHLTVPHTSPVRPGPGVEVHRTTRPVPWTARGGLRVTTAYQTVLDLARACRYVEGVSYADAALHAQCCDPDELVRRVGRVRYLPGARRARAVVRDCRVGAQSPMETRTRLLLVGAGLPEPQLQHRVPCVIGGRPVNLHVDLGWPAQQVCVEYDGRGPHGADRLMVTDDRSDPFARDRRRWRALRDAGWDARPVTAADLRVPALLVAEVRRALARTVTFG